MKSRGNRCGSPKPIFHAFHPEARSHCPIITPKGVIGAELPSFGVTSDFLIRTGGACAIFRNANGICRSGGNREFAPSGSPTTPE
jgi:hypothetical protein